MPLTPLRDTWCTRWGQRLGDAKGKQTLRHTVAKAGGALGPRPSIRQGSAQPLIRSRVRWLLRLPGGPRHVARGIGSDYDRQAGFPFSNLLRPRVATPAATAGRQSCTHSTRQALRSPESSGQVKRHRPLFASNCTALLLPPACALLSLTFISLSITTGVIDKHLVEPVKTASGEVE